MREQKQMALTLVLIVVSCLGALAHESGKSLTQLLSTIPKRESELFTMKLAQESGKSPTQLLSTISRNESELAVMKKEATNKLQGLAPIGKQTYGDFTWKCVFTGYTTLYSANDATNGCHISVTLIYNDKTPAGRGKWGSTCEGYPATRLPNHVVRVLVGKVDLSVSIQDKDLQSDKVTDQIVASFKLADIAKL
jgi:hypothetical protein